MDSFWQDLLYGARTLRQKPGFAIVSILALALGIGATTAVFSVVDSVLLRPLPYRNADELVSVDATLHGEAGTWSYADGQELRDRRQAFADVALFRPGDAVLTGEGQSLHVDTLETSAALLRTLGVTPALGRDFADSDVVAGAPVALISHALWMERYRGDAAVLGRSISVDGQPVTVIGVLPAGVRFPADAGYPAARIHLLFPRTVEDKQLAQTRSDHSFRMIARVAAGASLERARADLDRITALLRTDHPSESEDKDLGARLTSLRQQLVAPVRPALLILLLAAACVLLIAGMNVAGLQLARALGREREIAIRAALGASRRRLIRQMLTESVLLGLLGGVAGTLLAQWLLAVLVAAVAPSIPHIHDVALNLRALLFMLALSITTALGFGLWPALRASVGRLTESFADSGRSSTGRAAARRARKALLVVEIAVAVVMLVAAGSSARSVAALLAVDPGFTHEGLVVAQLNLSPARFGNDDALDGYGRRLRARLASLSGADATALGGPLPFSAIDLHISVAPPGAPPNPALRDALLSTVSPEYFHTMGIRLVAGRVFSTADDQRQAAPTIIVSQSFARRMFGSAAAALGQRLQLGINRDTPEIVGVVTDVRTQALDVAPIPTMYVPFGRTPLSFVGVVVRTSLPPAVMTAALRQALLDVDIESPPLILASADSLLADTLLVQRAMAVLLAVFAALALALAAVGVYGVIAHTVGQRTREIGIRMALGAKRRDVLRLVVGEILRLTLLALGIGIALSLAAGRALQSGIYQLSAVEPLTLAAVVVVVLASSLLASWLPARRATKIDPHVALLHE